MTIRRRGVLFALIFLGVLGMVAIGESKDSTTWLYRRVLELSGAGAEACANGTVEQRLDCLGRQIDELGRRLDKPRVIPL